MTVKVYTVQIRKPSTHNKINCKGEKNKMRKEKVYTRSFTTKKAEVLGFNPAETETVTETFTVPSNLEDEKILEYLRKHVVDEKVFVPVKLLSVDVKTEIRGIKESVFYTNSFPMESRHNASSTDE